MIDDRIAANLVEIVLAGVEREYPNYVQSLMLHDGDLRPPRERTPAFFGCFDWHSAVHSHWTLVRLRRTLPGAAWVDEVECVLDRRLSEANLAGEVDFLSRPQNQRFECPYGLAWLLQLGGECRECAAAGCERSAVLAARLEPLERLGRERMFEWLEPLPRPVRSGQHPQSAFAMGLCLDWARTVGDRAFEELLVRKSLEFHGGDRNGPLRFEPSAYDFVSPCFAEADLLRRVLGPAEFAAWLSEFLPTIPTQPDDWLEPAICPDESDGKLSHLNGLNLSRAWMLDGIAHGVPADDPRIPALLTASECHAAVGVTSVNGEHYAGAHWLPSFAAYHLTRRGVSSRAE